MNEVTRILPHDEFLEGDKTIEPIGDYGDPVKITEEEVNEIAEALETTTSDETKIMQDISKNGVSYNKETNMTEVISEATADPETGLYSFKPVSNENNSKTLADLLEDENGDIVNDINITDDTYQKAGDMFNIKDIKVCMDIINIVKRFKSGEKFDYYSELPHTLKQLAVNMAMGSGVSKKEAAKDILTMASQDLGIEQSSLDFNQMVKKELELPNMTEMYAEFLQERIEKGYEEIAQKLETAGQPEKAEAYRDIIDAFKDTYTFDRLFAFANENKSFVRKLKKEIKRYERWVTDFNYKYKGSKFTIFDITLIINSIMRALETTLDIDQAKKIMVLIAKSVQNYDSNNVVDHSYMFYLIYHFTTLDHVAPGKSEFTDTFKSNIVKLAQLIETIENEKV